MRSNKYIYEKQQCFYYGFELLPLQDLKTYNGFEYKTYSVSAGDIRQLFDDPFNQEVLDRHYAVSMLWEIRTNALLLVKEVVSRFVACKGSLKKIYKIQGYEKCVHDQITNIEKCNDLLTMYIKNLMKPVALELQQLLDNQNFRPSVQICSRHLQHIEKLILETGKLLKNKIEIIGNNIPGRPILLKNALQVNAVSEDLIYSLALLQKFYDVNLSLSVLINQWINNRLIHEEQEILN